MLLYLHDVPLFDEVLVQQVVQDRVQFFTDIFDQQRAPQGEGILQVGAEVLVVQGSHLEGKLKRNNDNKSYSNNK